MTLARLLALITVATAVAVAVAVAVLACLWIGCLDEDSFPLVPDDVHEPNPGILYAIDVQTGEEVWTRRWDDNVPWTVLAAEGRVYYLLFDAGDASLYAVEGKSGRTVGHK